MKRMFDFVLAAAGLLVSSPLMLLAALVVKIDSPGPVFFKQRRVGKDFRLFSIYKFRTMRRDTSTQGPQITVGSDPRITRAGRLLRKTKIDELPQLINVVLGDMSLVGPRPEVRRYVELFRKDYEEILKVRPGITDLASLKYRDEATLLATASNPEEEYRQVILPEKIELAKQYVRNSSLLFDVGLILRTLAALCGFNASCDEKRIDARASVHRRFRI